MEKWKVADGLVEAHIGGVEARFISVEKAEDMCAGCGVALVQDHPNKAANAALIAAAPELLEALKRMHESGISWGLHECGIVSDRAAMEMAAAAIAKAEGGAR